MRLYQSLLIPSLAALSWLCLQGCAWEKKEDDVGRNSVKVQIPISIDGAYKLDVVELFTLKNVSSLKGLAARFLMDPESRNDGKLTGRPPEIRYIRDRDGVIVAKDSLSLQLLAVYTHFEKLKELDEQIGAKDVLSYPRVVAVNAQFRRSNGEVEENNALYSGKYDALMIERYTQEELPLMANAGVIGHEHFHALFQKLVVEPLKGKYPGADRPTGHDEKKKLAAFGLIAPVDSSVERKGRDWAEDTTVIGPCSEESLNEKKKDPAVRKRYHETLLRGINEGMADVLGWIYSGDPQFVGRSLPQVKMDRDLEQVPRKQLYAQNLILEAVACGNYSDEALITKFSYPHGTQLALTLKNFARMYAARKNLSPKEMRMQLGQFLIAALPDVKKDLESLKDDDYYTLSRALVSFATQVKDLTREECNFLGKLMPLDDRQRTQFPEFCRKISDPQKDHEQEENNPAPRAESGDPLK